MVEVDTIDPRQCSDHRSNHPSPVRDEPDPEAVAQTAGHGGLPLCASRRCEPATQRQTCTLVDALAPLREERRVEVPAEHVGPAASGPLGAGIGRRASRSQPLTRRYQPLTRHGLQANLITSHPSSSSRRGEGVRKADATRGGRLIDPAIATPKNLHLREVLLYLIASELSLHARSPPNETSMNASGCPG